MPTTKNLKGEKEFLQLWDDYKKEVDEDPHVEEVSNNKGGITKLKRPRPYTRQGFQSYVYRVRGFHIHQYIDNYENRYDEYLGVVTCVRAEWENDQISGALTGRYKSPNLVARLNNIKEQIDNVNTNNNRDLLSNDPLSNEGNNGTA